MEGRQTAEMHLQRKEESSNVDDKREVRRDVGEEDWTRRDKSPSKKPTLLGFILSAHRKDRRSTLASACEAKCRAKGGLRTKG